MRMSPKRTSASPKRASASPKRGQRTSHNSGSGPRIVFATVGTTQFDELTTTLLSDEVLSTLAAQGYTRLVMQLGRGTEPSLPSSPPPPLQIDCHAGAGSILEGMRLRAIMVVVVNDALMHNHQQELAGELHERRHLLSTVPSQLAVTLRDLGQKPPAFEPWPPADETAFPRFLATELGL
ncbi:udp-n-acetylglucosamine transferase subunit alg13-like protein [Chrysochromulina tobinii]|uniref:Udp-n-acetylglucosamine transferase subunit alg13-like protein n=1 Tax=Chrysochromulina tobinii TaxID=1460289 RepID=A0A0M0JAK0_9EUKA|nr:udp-n-acetylglucosamine transferase subunit alg13-like protein [Chrysochromulina tobinii]|eukprot:KOO23495.1 udp-n-acetylglucosamine transferase subunit alg13-like protein [Chrysochromulina sp. CCMP291]